VKTTMDITFDKTEKLDFTQPFNKVKYRCKECKNSWIDSEFMDAFRDRDFSKGWGLGGEYSKIQRSVAENMFRAPGTTIGIVCPHCCSEHERKAGQIEVKVIGQEEKEEELEYISENYPHALEDALGKLFNSGLEMDENGRIKGR
jgi:hypothetical protein